MIRAMPGAMPGFGADDIFTGNVGVSGIVFFAGAMSKARFFQLRTNVVDPSPPRWCRSD